MTAHKHPVAPVPASVHPLSGAGTNPIGATRGRALLSAQSEGISPTGEAGAPSLSTLITADASKVSGRDFLDAVTGNSPAKREQRRHEEQQRCIRAIERGDTYGFPPVMVEECKRIMAEDDAALVYVERIAPGRVAL